MVTQYSEQLSAKFMKIVSYNVNGIRAAIRKGLWTWLSEESPDIFCVQELKATESQVDLSALAEMGYAHILWHSAEKKGYSGVAIFSKTPFVSTRIGLGEPRYDNEGRFVCASFKNFDVLNAYFPSGTSGQARQDFKYRWLDDFWAYLSAANTREKPTIIVGDFNIAHQAIDIHNPKRNKNTSGFQPAERAWMTKFLESGFIDSYRFLSPQTQAYSWWSYRAGARKKNLGWRIDYIMLTKHLQPNLQAAQLLNEIEHSDHCPLSVVLS